jgi:hypothetical protein
MKAQLSSSGVALALCSVALLFFENLVCFYFIFYRERYSGQVHLSIIVDASLFILFVSSDYVKPPQAKTTTTSVENKLEHGAARC